MSSFPPVPVEVKGIAHFLKIADEHESRNIVVSYWCRMHACQTVMKLLPGKKPPAVSQLLIAVLDWLEATKKEHHDTEGIGDETTAQAMIEQYALQLFTFADSQDRAGNFNKNMVKGFYTAGVLMDTLEQFGPLSEDITARRKYAKWKAAYIHNCLKAGEIPQPGGFEEEGGDQNENATGGGSFDAASNSSDQPGPSGNSTPPDTMPPVDPVAPAPAPSPITPSLPSDLQVPFTPAPAFPSSDGAAVVDPDAVQKAQKYCKYATSALNYDDVKTAIDNLTKALNLLHTGHE